MFRATVARTLTASNEHLAPTWRHLDNWNCPINKPQTQPPTMDNTTNSTFNGTFDGGNGTFNGTSGDPFTTPVPKPFWTGLLLPTAYLIILIGSLYSFSSVYRQRQVSRASKLEPWFPQHVTRNIYLSLLHLDPETASAGSDDEKKLSKVPDSVLKAALLKRAVEDIQRIVQLRQAKPALQTLLQRGSVGDELWQRFQRAEQEMEIEVKDVVNEVRFLIFPSAKLLERPFLHRY